MLLVVFSASVLILFYNRQPSPNLHLPILNEQEHFNNVHKYPISQDRSYIEALASSSFER